MEPKSQVRNETRPEPGLESESKQSVYEFRPKSDDVEFRSDRITETSLSKHAPIPTGNCPCASELLGPSQSKTFFHNEDISSKTDATGDSPRTSEHLDHSQTSKLSDLRLCFDYLPEVHLLFRL